LQNRNSFANTIGLIFPAMAGLTRGNASQIGKCPHARLVRKSEQYRRNIRVFVVSLQLLALTRTLYKHHVSERVGLLVNVLQHQLARRKLAPVRVKSMKRLARKVLCSVMRFRQVDVQTRFDFHPPPCTRRTRNGNIFNLKLVRMMVESVRASVHVKLSEISGGQKHFDCGRFHSFQEFACLLAPGRMVLQNANDKTSTALCGLMLAVSDMDEKQLDGYEQNSDIPVVMFQFRDRVSLELFLERATASQCATLRIRPKNGTSASAAPPPQAAVHTNSCSVVSSLSPKATHVTDATDAHQQHAKEIIADAYPQK
jgi:hypothetical protein